MNSIRNQIWFICRNYGLPITICDITIYDRCLCPFGGNPDLMTGWYNQSVDKDTKIDFNMVSYEFPFSIVVVS